MNECVSMTLQRNKFYEVRHCTLTTGTKLEEVYIIAGKKKTAFSINNDVS